MGVTIEKKELYLIGGSFIIASLFTSNWNFTIGCTFFVLPSLIKAMEVKDGQNKKCGEYEKVINDEKSSITK